MKLDARGNRGILSPTVGDATGQVQQHLVKHDDDNMVNRILILHHLFNIFYFQKK